SPAATNVVDNQATTLTNDSLGLFSAAGPRKTVSLPTLSNAVAPTSSGAPATAGLVESPIGVATPAPALVATTNGLRASQPSLGAAPSSTARVPVQEAQPSPAPALQSTPLASSTAITPVLRPLSNLHVTVNHYRTEGVHS